MDQEEKAYKGIVKLASSQLKVMGGKAFGFSLPVLLEKVFGVKEGKLSCVEVQVIFFLLHGFEISEIAKEMSISRKKLRETLEEIFKSLDVSSRIDLQSRIFIYFLQRRKIILVPSRESISDKIETILNFEDMVC